MHSKRWRWLGLGAASFVLAVVLAALWIFTTSSGTRWALEKAVSALHGAFQYQDVSGTLAGPLTLSGLRYDASGGLTFVADKIDVDLQWTALLHGTAHIDSARLSGATLTLAKSAPEPTPSEPFDFNPPIDIEVDQLTVLQMQVRRADSLLLDMTRGEFVGQWTQRTLAIERLAIDSSQGEIQAAGHVENASPYRGNVHANVRWNMSGKTYAGRIAADARQGRVSVGARLTAPMEALLDVSLEQRTNSPWTAEVTVPKFNAQRVLNSSSLQTLAVALHGSGERTSGDVEGRIGVNGKYIDINALRFDLRDNTLVLDPLKASLAETQGVINASGKVQLNNSQAHLEIGWQNVQLPKEWVGQKLNTHGALTFDGGPDRYAGNGNFALGPPGRLANISVQASGTSKSLELQKFAIAQPKGSLHASGTLSWQPQLEWKITAHATHFNPGELFPEWKGNIDLTCVSDGRKNDEGFQVAVDLSKLDGTLRGRHVHGVGKIDYSSPASLAGNLRLTADHSSIEIHGAPGKAIDANAVLKVASLNDWIPNGGGSLDANFTAKGTWPKLAIEGQATGSHLRLAGTAAEKLDVSFAVRDPLHPSGSGRVRVATLSTGGFEFTTLNAKISGRESKHQLDFVADGKPVSANLRIQGARDGDQWTGTVRRLSLNVDRAGQFALRMPAAVEISAAKKSVEELCLDGRKSKLCAFGESTADGALSIKYNLEKVPLRLVSSFVPTLPVSIAGALEGQGDVRRSADGKWSGRATIESASGQLSRSLAKSDTSPVLLTYQQLRATAILGSSAAHAHVTAKLDHSGSLEGNLAVTNMQAASMQMDGEVQATLPNLAALSVLSPQIAKVAGRAQLRATIAGTTTAPRFGGELHAAQLAAELPALGLKVKDGVLDATPSENGIDLSGHVSSGKGQLGFQGEWAQSELRLAITGSNFLIADIPSAHVVVAPDLKLREEDHRFQLDGRVAVTQATIDIQKLPRGAKPPQASPDVVVVDRKTPSETAEESIPLVADITVTFGEEVKIEGYGLNATVGGQLEVREQPASVTRGSGEVTVAGTYKAYGQDLTIQQGHVLYADAPIANPRLNIMAVRKVEEVTAGLRITGPAQDPQLSIFSEPAMGEAEALSYLVAGRPLDQIGTGESDGSALQSAARSLESAGGGLLAKKLGARLGVSELSVKDNDLIGGAAFTVGEYLSPRIFLSYGVGLFEPGEVVTLRYRLSNSWSVQTERGSEETRAGIQYRAEK